MRVALDITSLVGARTGVGVFTSKLAERLAARSDVQLVTFAATARGRSAAAAASPAGARTVRRPMAARPLRALWRRAPFPPIEVFTGAIDVVHGPNYVVPPARRAATVVSVHDLTVLHFPELCTSDTLTYPELVRRALQRGAWVHVDTHAVGEEFIDAFGAPAERVVTVPLAPEPVDHADPDEGRRIAGSGRYLLALGTVEPRKDLPGLVRAFDRMAREHDDLRLVIAGPDGWGSHELDTVMEASANRDRIRRLGWVDRHQRAALLRGAQALVYPSRYEGFGLPPLEAMSVRTPVVATDVPAVAETCGGAAYLVPTGDPDALAGALSEVVSDAALRERLSDSGEANVARFSWERTAEGMVALYTRATLP